MLTLRLRRDAATLRARGGRTVIGVLALAALLTGCPRAGDTGDGGTCTWSFGDAGSCPNGLTADGGAPTVDSVSGATVFRNLTYGTRGGYALQGDLWVPDGVSDGGTRSGVMVLIHGGGWNDCARRRDTPTVEAYAQVESSAIQAAAFNIEYRLTEEGGAYPEDVQDVLCATEWISAHAGDYGLDGSRIALVGESAGAHLALLAALEHNLPDLDPKCGPMPAITGVVSYSGPTDLPSLAAGNAEGAASAAAYAGPCTDPVPTCDVGRSCNRCIDASPIAHDCVGGATQTAFVLVQAPDAYDPIVPLSQAQTLANDFTLAGVPSSLLVPTAAELDNQGCAANDPAKPAHGMVNFCLTGATGNVVTPFLQQRLGPK